MNLKEKAMEGLRFCNDPKTEMCDGCVYLLDEKWSDEGMPLCMGMMEMDALNVIKAYDFAWSQFKSTLEELIENNDGDVKVVCTFLYNLMRIREVDIGKGEYV